MFALAAFITRGGIFILYCAWHIMSGHQELEENRKRRPLTMDELVELNLPENLTEQDKQYFYTHPFAYKDKNGQYVTKNDAYFRKFLRLPAENEILMPPGKEESWDDFPREPRNPRFKKEKGYQYWWNRPYWDAVDKDQIDYLLAKKSWLEEHILKEVLGYHLIYSERSYYYERVRHAEATKEDVAKNLNHNHLYINDYGKHYAKLKEQMEWYEQTSKERNEQLWMEEQKSTIDIKNM